MVCSAYSVQDKENHYFGLSILSSIPVKTFPSHPCHPLAGCYFSPMERGGNIGYMEYPAREGCGMCLWSAWMFNKMTGNNFGSVSFPRYSEGGADVYSGKYQKDGTFEMI